MPDPNAATIAARPRRRWWPLIKWTLFALMLFFVGKRAVSLWQSSPEIKLHVNAWWLLPAAALYLVGWLPSAWFWRAMLRRLGQRPTGYETVRAYFVGHMGKYVPGKALVLVIRGGLLKQAGCNPVLGGLTAAYETLVSMSAGAAIAVALAPAVIPDGLWERLPAAVQFLRQQQTLVVILVVVLTLASTPFSAWLFSRIGQKAVPQSMDATTTQITAGLVVQGLMITSLGWALHALSLGCTLQALADEPIDLRQFPVWLASVALSTFAGFVILVAPGGLGVREWVLIETLKDQPGIGAEKAIVVAGLLRIVWFVAELLIAGVLYSIAPTTRQPADSR